ncbi:photosynthetic NDH subunit of subcomplex B 2, chloroplastic [Cocos nucifera]|uniref:Photosynthetic NDH subunit of subcomplex B 2, chloroplastic n=1 Tax=Cocos nucifera TaxID=13894 RepID=A0A8K0MY33_COCNU|nr:photosynthetic NDH subunit of subcomplex B 2, chloroplastic [Cocos nucifera]
MASLLSLHLPKPNPNSPIRASSSSSPSTTTTTTQAPPQSLEQKFGRKGIKFTESGDVPTVELRVRNGSSLQLRIPDGLITSYKPKVYWKDEGFEEVIHTVGAGGPVTASSVKGGLGLVLNDVSRLNPDGSPWSASQWAVKDSDSDSIDVVQVELSCTNGDGSLDITYIVSLYPLSMATAVVVKNKGAESVKLTSAILSHLRFKSRYGSAVEGLRGCSYCAYPPLSSSFGILSPADAMEPEPPSWYSLLGSAFSKDNHKEAKDSWTVEDDLYTILRSKLSRVYTAPPTERLKRIYRTPPSKYTTIDQGSGLGFRVIRMGYDDIYLCSPGSFSRRYGKDYFICTGPASMLVPVVLNPGEEWRAAQVIEHDNL